MAANKTSWIDYLSSLQGNLNPNDIFPARHIMEILQAYKLSNAILSQSLVLLYLLDYTSGKYQMLSGSIKYLLGYEIEEIKREGVNMVLENYSPSQLRLFNEEQFPDRLKILKSVPVDQHKDLLFTHNFQFRKKNGEFVDLIQRNSFIQSDQEGNPLLSFGIVTNANHFVNENPVIQVVEKIDPIDPAGNVECIFKKSYYLNKEDRMFTRRERELLLWMAEGLTSEQIADKLFLSKHTILTHRKNMMNKCNARNVADMIGFAIRHRII